MANNPVGWFEVPVKDMARGKAFYEHVLGTTLELHNMGELEMAWFPANMEGYGAAGSLVRHPEWYKPSCDGSLVYFSVEDIPATLARAAAKGGKILQEKKSIGQYGFIGFFLDSEGNRIGLHSRA